MGLSVLLNGCSYSPWRSESASKTPPEQTADTASTPVDSTTRSGGYYKDDGPGENPPPDLLAIPDPVPKWETPHRFANRKYVALGREYAPDSEYKPYRAVGQATWYGRRFHGKPTASGEPYDMYAMTAAHPTLPIPSYARVTNLENGKSVIVRINDRGPFRKERLIDLSYTAAYKLNLAASGSGRVMVEAINPDEYAQSQAAHAPKTGPTQTAVPVPEASGIFLQVGAFGKRANAVALIERARTLLPDEKANLIEEDGLYRVRLGPYRNADEAELYRQVVYEFLGILPHKVLH
jgi:peptidoglycan lytic transglycosylase